MSSKGSKRRSTPSTSKDSDKRRKRATYVEEIPKEEGRTTRKRGLEEFEDDKSSKKSVPEQSKDPRQSSLPYVTLLENENPDEKFFPIAVVGIGCRMPGDVNCPDDFKKVMEDGIDVISEVPADRWSLDKYWHPDPHNVGTHANKRAGFCKNVHDFDHTFYNISPREAANMDVMQRHILEVTQEALDDGGIPSESLPRDTGVYVGICLMDHGFTVIEDAKCMNPYTHTGTAHSVTANRVSFAYDIRGPSVAIDTACAASLTSMHYACFGLWNKECPVALVTASNTLMVPEVTVGFNALGVLSPEGISCPFSANAKGYVRSEGTGSLVLKPLADAIKDGDHVYCTVRASWLAHNGYSLSITMPSTDAQAEMMKKTYDVFGLNRDNTDFIEAHGTGTPVGDPLEADGVARAFTLDETVSRKKPLAVGSSKSNFGHMEGAAGMVQVIKASLMLENRVMFPNINFGTPNPAIDVDNWNIYVPEKIVPYKEKKPFRVGVNTFGFGGALAHMVLEEPPKVPQPKRNKGHAGWKFGSHTKGLKIPIPLSAKSTAALRGFCAKWQEFESPDDAQEVVSWLATRRSHYSNRIVVFADSSDDFNKKMQMYIDKQAHEEIVEGTLPSHQEERKICFIFPGSGQQSFEMGRSLYRDEPVFRKTIDECDAAYKKISGKSFLKTYNLFIPIEPGKKYNREEVNEIHVSQPAILFLQIALHDLMTHWGIKPDAGVGHSLGEISMGYACGALTLEEAVLIQYHRAEQQRRLRGTGTMAALRVSAEEGEKICKKYKDLYIACDNAQEGITIAGSKQAIKDVCEAYPGNAKELRVMCAYHTPHMDPLEKEFMAATKGKLRNGRATNFPWYSTITGKKYVGQASAQYFWNNIRGRVEFLKAVQSVMNDFENVLFVEIASAATLLSSIRQIAKGENVTPAGMVPCGQRKVDDRVSTLRALATLHTMGVDMDWGNVTNNCGKWMRLPLYAWQHTPFRYEAEGMRSRRLDLEDRSFKGTHGQIRLEQQQFLRDHAINGQLVLPRAAYLEYMIETQFDPEALPALTNIKFHPELLSMSEDVDLNGEIPDRKQLSLENVQIQNGHRTTVVCDGIQYAQADVVPVKDEAKAFNLSSIKSKCKTSLSANEFYEWFAELGVEYTDYLRFKMVDQAYIGDGEALAYLQSTVNKHERLQTPLIDAAFTVALAAQVNQTQLLSPVHIDSLQMFVPKIEYRENYIVYAKLSSSDSLRLRSDIYVMDDSGKVLLELKGFEAQNVKGIKTENVDLKQCVYTTEWQPVKSCMPPTFIMKEFFSKKAMQKRYPNDMVDIEKAEKYNGLMKEICAAYARHAIKTTPKKDIHQKMERYANRLQQMADTIPSSMTFEQLPGVMEKLEKECPEYHQENFMIEKMGNVLPETLKDPKVGLTALFTEEMMAAYFIDSITTKIYYKMLGDAVRTAVEEARKSKKIIRVLEVGGRLGGMTEYILPCIEDYLKDGSVEYCFTDINVAFFSLVQEKLKAFPNVKFQQFDPENDIKSQHFVPNSYDLVVCLDTLHCTENGVHATSSIRDLLCQDGMLAVMESTNNHNTPEIIFGVFDLCWVFNDERQDRCWMSQKGWTKVMEDSGFSDVVCVSTPNEFYHSLIFGRKTNMELFYEVHKPAPAEGEEENVEEAMETGDPMWLLVHLQDASIANSLKSHLPKGTKTVTVNKFVNMQKTLDTHDGPLNIVYFWDESDKELKETLSVIHTCQQLDERSKSSLWLVTKGGCKNGTALDTAIATGFMRAACSEVKNMQLYMVDVEDGPINGQVGELVNLLQNHTHTDHEISIQGSTRLVPRIIRRPLETKVPLNGAEWRVEATPKMENVLDSIDFHKFTNSALSNNEVRVAVKAVGISRTDINSMSKDELTTKMHLGQECAGVVQMSGPEVNNVSPSDEVIAFGSGCLASNFTTDSSLVFRKPSGVTMTDAAGLGLAYSTAYYALVDKANVQKGETVLIHSACGGVGQAAVQLAKYLGSKVICTASSDGKKAYLRERCAVTLISDSRSAAFYDDVMSWTDGAGADVVINLYGGEILEKSLQCLAHGGRFCQIGDKDVLQNSRVVMDALSKNASVHSVQIDVLMEKDRKRFGDIMRNVLALLDDFTVAPVPVNVYDISSVPGVLKQANDIDTIGRIVMEIPTNFRPETVEPALNLFRPDVTYLITGSSGGIGQEVARWMADTGAKHVVLVSKNGHKSWFQKDTVRYMEDLGVTVYDVRADLGKEKDVRQMFRLLKNNGTPDIKGIFHLAGINQDVDLENLTSKAVAEDIKVRAQGAQLLHRVTSDLHMTLDHFVLFSSSKAAWGNPNLASFCASCSYLDQLAVARRQQGLPAVSIQAGWLRGAGWLEDRQRTGNLLQYTKGATMHVREFLSVLHKILDQPDLPPVVMVSNEDWDSAAEFTYKDSLLFRHYATSGGKKRGGSDLSKDALQQKVVEKLGNLLMMSPDDIDVNQPMIHYGVDSLISLDITNWMRKEFNLQINQMDILEGMTTITLIEEAL